MPNFYTYFIASLPTLHFASPPPFSIESFLERCNELIPEQDLEIIRSIFSGEPQDHPTIKQWIDFDTMLKNELVRLRSGRRKKEAEKYLRPDGYAGASIYHLALAAQKHPSVLEGEKILDHARWDFLEELSVGHYFDLELLIVYAYKLLTLGRWQRIHGAEKQRLLDEILAQG